MSLLPPKQRPGESDLDWAMRLWDYNARCMDVLKSLAAWILVAGLVAIALVLWRLA